MLYGVIEFVVSAVVPGTGRVVAVAVGINVMNTGGKFLAWFFTGSHAMFSEAIHSLADTINQVGQ